MKIKNLTVTKSLVILLCLVSFLIGAIELFTASTSLAVEDCDDTTPFTPPSNWCQLRGLQGPAKNCYIFYEPQYPSGCYAAGECCTCYDSSIHDWVEICVWYQQK